VGRSAQPGLPFATPEEAVTLASIVEKETGLAGERPRVAAVFLNRLRAGMRLESDPTIIYGITKGGRWAGASCAVELRRPDALQHLPDRRPAADADRQSGPGALAAVLNPPKTDELYFVADGTGGHVFASTYEEHERNVAAGARSSAKAAAAGPLSGGSSRMSSQA
jgi:UPF0755 protein